MYRLEHPETVLEPGIYFLRNLFAPGFDPDVIYKPAISERFRVTDYSPYEADFKECFDACLEEIFDTETAFTQTPTGKACEWCSFTNICKK
jgi:hypothetical protein